MSEGRFSVVEEGQWGRVIVTDGRAWTEIASGTIEWAWRIADAMNRPVPDVAEVESLRAANLVLAETLVERDRELSACRGGHV